MREGEMNKPNYLRKKYTEYVEKYENTSLEPICRAAFEVMFSRYMDRSWEDEQKFIFHKYLYG